MSYREPVCGKCSNSNNERWISFDISQLTRRLLHKMKSTCKTMATVNLTITVKTRKPFSLINKFQNPLPHSLEVLPLPPSSTLKCTPGETRCCKEEAVVSFKKSEALSRIILYPYVFRTAYCRGTCEDGLHNGACCVPTKARSLSVLFRDGDIIQANILPNVVVQECGCRYNVWDIGLIHLK